MYAYIILRCGTLMPFMSIYAKNEPARILYNKRSLCCLITSIIGKRLIGGRPLFGTPKGRKPFIYGLLPFVTIAQTYIEVVEARGIEPLSENSSIQLSTSVFYLLRFLWQTAGKRAESQSSPYANLRHGHSSDSFTTDRCPSGSRGTHPEDSS